MHQIISVISCQASVSTSSQVKRMTDIQYGLYFKWIKTKSESRVTDGSDKSMDPVDEFLKIKISFLLFECLQVDIHCVFALILVRHLHDATKETKMTTHISKNENWLFLRQTQVFDSPRLRRKQTLKTTWRTDVRMSFRSYSWEYRGRRLTLLWGNIARTLLLTRSDVSEDWDPNWREKSSRNDVRNQSWDTINDSLKK